MQHLPDVNLNLLLSLKALIETRGVTRAAERLGMTQPTMSRHLSQLREMFDDPLLVRAGTSFALTERATELGEALEATLSGLESLFQSESDPAVVPREFLIAAPDTVATYILGDAMAEMLTATENFSVSLLNWDTQAKNRLLSGDIHLAISIKDDFSPNIYRQKIGTDRWVCMMRRGHPLAQRAEALTRDDVLRYEHVSARTGGGRDKQVDAWLHRHGIHRDIRVSTEGYLPLCAVVGKTDFVAIVPWHVARVNGELFDLTYAMLDFDIRDVTYYIWWHERYHHDRGHKRLREFIVPKIRDHPAHEGIFRASAR